jgi:hypothetical protein
MIRFLVLITLLAGSAALACGACDSSPVVSLKDLSRNVPTNVVFRVWNLAPTPTGYVLRKKSDNVGVPLRFSTGPGFRLWTIAPETALDPKTEYVLSTLTSPIGFTTGETDDHVAPRAPVLTKVTHNRPKTNPCGVSESWVLEVEELSDDSTPGQQLLIFVQTNRSNEPADARFVTTLSNLLLSRSCGDFTPPEGDSFPVAVQVMDLAGNISELSEEKRAPACSASLGGAMWVLAISLLRSRRRER